jgi:hypothetical protein
LYQLAPGVVVIERFLRLQLVVALALGWVQESVSDSAWEWELALEPALELEQVWEPEQAWGWAREEVLCHRL